jgi:hypothetical protein
MPVRTLGGGVLSRTKMESETGHQEPTDSRADVGAILDGLPAMVNYETRQGTLVSSDIRDVPDGRRSEDMLAGLAGIVDCRWRNGAD